MGKLLEKHLYSLKLYHFSAPFARADWNLAKEKTDLHLLHRSDEIIVYEIPVYRAVENDTVGADIIRPTVEYYEFAENRCGIATFYRRAVNNRPYIGYGTSNR